MHTKFSGHMLGAKHKTNEHLHSHSATYMHTNTHTCARSPSYLYSQVNAASSNFFITSPTPFVGWANMGLSGMPGRRKVVRELEKVHGFKNSRTPEQPKQQKVHTKVMHFSWTINSWETNGELAQEKFATLWHTFRRGAWPTGFRSVCKN